MGSGKRGKGVLLKMIEYSTRLINQIDLIRNLTENSRLIKLLSIESLTLSIKRLDPIALNAYALALRNPVSSGGVREKANPLVPPMPVPRVYFVRIRHRTSVR